VRAAAFLLCLLLLAGCDTGADGAGTEEPTETAEVPTPPPSPARTLGPEAPPPDEVDPCLLDDEEVGAIAGTDLPRVGASGGEVFALCTYGEPDLGVAADIAVVDLVRVREDSGEDVDGDTYVDTLTEGVGAGDAEALDGYGDGRAVRLSYALGSQAWAHVGDTVYGAYASGLGDDDAIAVALLEAVLATVAD
jgi:hypothetical protein